MNKALICAVLALLLSACAQTPKKKIANQVPAPVSSAPIPTPSLPPSAGPAEQGNAKVCRQVMQHDERNYTKGGLYAPGVADAHPDGELDVSLLREPEPRSEPRSRYGNRSPYTVLGKKYFVMDETSGYRERGIASWYGTKFHGRATSSGEIYDMCQFSAAHKTLPIPSFARVTRLDTGQSVIVRVNDRGPFHDSRLIDLSFAAASKLGITRSGTAKVEVVAITGDGAEMAASPAQFEPAHDDKPYLQVASFAIEDNAKALKQRLQAADIDDVFIQKQRINDEPVWRVRIGPLKSAEIAKIQQLLRERGLNSVRVAGE
jgi:rare lipoprotein A